MDDAWIIVPNWDRFQHYKDRDPPWIKVYTELNSRDEFLKLTPSARGLLLTIWLEFARSRGRLRTTTLVRLCGPYTRGTHLKPLIDAGFIQLSASAHALAREEVERREETRTREDSKPNSSAYQPPPPEPTSDDLAPMDKALELARLMASKQTLP